VGLAHRHERRVIYIRVIEPIIVDYPEDWKDATIYPIYDVHVGSPEFDEKAFTAYIQRIQADPRGLVILGGDLIDNATRHSVSNIYEAPMMPMKQKKLVTEMLKPISRKVIAVVTGNHERRTMKDVGQDITYDVCTKLDLEDKYRDGMAFIKLRFGRNATHTSNGNLIMYTILATHGAGGGMYLGGTINKTENFINSVDGVDIMVTGHVHKIGISRPTKLIFDSNHNCVTPREMLNVICGAWTQYGGYAAEKLLRPGSMGAARIMLSGSRKEYEAVV